MSIFMFFFFLKKRKNDHFGSLWHLLDFSLWTCPTGRRPCSRPKTGFRDYLSHLAGGHHQRENTRKCFHFQPFTYVTSSDYICDSRFAADNIKQNCEVYLLVHLSCFWSDQKPGWGVYMSQYPGFYQSTPDSTSCFLKTGSKGLIWESETGIRCLHAQIRTRILQKLDHIRIVCMQTHDILMPCLLRLQQPKFWNQES